MAIPMFPPTTKTQTKPTPISPHEWEQQYIQTVEGWFKNHVVRESASDNWLICTPDGSSIYMAEIAVVRFGCILIHGDIPDVLFRGGPAEALSKVHWVAASGVDYLASKVRAGTKRCWVPEAAVHALDGHVEDLKSALYDDEVSSELNKLFEALAEIRESLLDGGMGQEEFHQKLYEATDDSELLCWGDVVSPDVIVAHVAAKTLWRLLKEKEL